MALIFVFSRNSTDFPADYITVVKDRPILSVKYCVGICTGRCGYEDCVAIGPIPTAVVWAHGPGSIVVLVTACKEAVSMSVTGTCEDSSSGPLSGTCPATKVRSQDPLVALSLASLLPTMEASPTSSSVERPKSPSDPLALLGGRGTGSSRDLTGELDDWPSLTFVRLRVFMAQLNGPIPGLTGLNCR